MDNKSNNLSGNHIWLRYATQFTNAGRTYTVEMSVPMPIGASAETREQLVQEAEIGMNLLVQRVDSRVAHMLQSNQQTPAAATTPRAATPVKSAATPAPQTTVQQPAIQTREMMPEQVQKQHVEEMVPPTRTHIGASMPLTLGPTNDSSGNLPLPEFIQYIKESLGLDPKQAMNLLKVKTLSTINRREALAQLRLLVAQEGTGGAEVQPKTRENIPLVTPTARPSANSSPSTPPQEKRTLRMVSNEPEQEEDTTTVREERPIYVFDEEVGPDDELLEDEPNDFEQPRELTTQERVKARTILNRLRESRGATTASQGRLQVLNTIAVSQVTEEQLQELVDGAWRVNALKKLKVDQVEALISWAKEDNFVNELEAVLALLEEERYARGNR